MVEREQEEYLEGYNYPYSATCPCTKFGRALHAVSLVKNNSELSKVRKLTGAGSNAEGWRITRKRWCWTKAYNNDPRYRLAQLVDALLRDCRYIVGIKMHTQGMTMEQARNSLWKKDVSNRLLERWKRSAHRRSDLSDVHAR